MATVLLVEDNFMTRVLVRDALTLRGITVFEATTGEEAIERIKTNPPDMVLMDIGLPGMDGITAMKGIKALHQTGKTPVIAITASAMKGDEERLLSEGFDGYISKPIDIKELIEVVKRFQG